jgi:RNase H-fold protein (predicted Holliday junction resolvase)
MNCKDIENILPLYPDDLFSAAEKQAVEEHLKVCPKCCKELGYLQQTAKMAHDLKEVDPPPWFKQKIMAKVHEAAYQKSFLHKWFYPLRIKIPVQIVATVVITVLAVYIYRAGEQEMRAVLPSVAPVAEAPKEVSSTQAEAQEESVFPGQRIKKKVGPKGRGGLLLKEEEKKSVADKIAAEKDAVLDRTRENSGAMLSTKQELPAPASPVEKRAAAHIGESRKSIAYKATVPAAPQPVMDASRQKQTVISVYAKDIDGAARNIEKILGKYEAQNIVKQTLPRQVTITAELKTQSIKAFVEQLETVGKVEEKVLPPDNSEQYNVVIVEIRD